MRTLKTTIALLFLLVTVNCMGSNNSEKRDTFFVSNEAELDQMKSLISLHVLKYISVNKDPYFDDKHLDGLTNELSLRIKNNPELGFMIYIDEAVNVLYTMIDLNRPYQDSSKLLLGLLNEGSLMEVVPLQEVVIK